MQVLQSSANLARRELYRRTYLSSQDRVNLLNNAAKKTMTGLTLANYLDVVNTYNSGKQGIKYLFDSYRMRKRLQDNKNETFNKPRRQEDERYQ